MRARDQIELEARRSALHKLSAAAFQVVDAIALFDHHSLCDVADLDPTAHGAAMKIATAARTLAADIKRQIDALKEES